MAREGTSWVVALAIGALALALRLFGLDRKSVWFDEAITYFDAHAPWSGLLDSVRSDVHPPLNYVLYHLWPGVDAGDFWLRLPAAVLGAAAAVVAWAWARRIGTPGQALLTGGFVALAPLQIDLAQEARMYGLLLLLTAVSLLLLDSVLTCPKSTTLVPYAAVASLMLYTHYYAAFLLAAEGATVLFTLRGASRPAALKALAALLVAGVLFVPWLPVLAEQARNIQGDYWIEAPRWTTLWVTFRELAAHTPPDEPFRIPLRIAYVVEAGLLVWGGVLATRNQRQRAALLLGILPLGLALGMSVLVAPVFAVRYVSPIGLAFGFLLARAITALPKPAVLIAGAVAFAPLLVSLPPLYVDPGYSRADLRGAAHAVQAARQTSDVVLHLGAFTSAPFDYYKVGQPGHVLETNDYSELCQVLRPHTGGWLVTAYQPGDDDARQAAEAGITAATYAQSLVPEPPMRFDGVSIFRLSARC
ncbi:MAG TPA: glycosyltransferase family 39 protein [Chloroflexota bacterium]